jgi:hypothetical protein
MVVSTANVIINFELAVLLVRLCIVYIALIDPNGLYGQLFLFWCAQVHDVAERLNLNLDKIKVANRTNKRIVWLLLFALFDLILMILSTLIMIFMFVNKDDNTWIFKELVIEFGLLFSLVQLSKWLS